jgi:hypothetical protein
MKSITLEDKDNKQTEVFIREYNNEDREIITNECVEISADGSSRSIKGGTLKKYTFILGIAKAPFFTQDIADTLGITDRILQSRLQEYKFIDPKIIDTLLPAIAELNQIDTAGLEILKKN